MTATISIKNEIHQMHRKLNKNQISITEWWAFIEDKPKEIVGQVVRQSLAAVNRLQDYKKSSRVVNKVRKYCTELGYTDRYPFEVVKVVSEKIVEIRALDAVQVVAPKEFYPGGFSGHYADNHNQEYTYNSNEKNGTRRIHLGKKGWGNGRYLMMDRPYKFHDYNF